MTMKLDQDELACRMLEAAVGVTRPHGLTAIESLMRGPAHLREAYQRAAVAAISYFIECAGPIDVLSSPREPTDSDRSKINGASHGRGG